MRTTTRRQKDESPETHEMREMAGRLMELMWAAMTDADDFDPTDGDARARSEYAKEERKAADDRFAAGDWITAIEHAAAVIRCMGGN